MYEWKPIETARDDISILMGVWSNGKFYQATGNIYTKQGYRRTLTTGFRKNEFPTHWMELQKPPKESK